MSQGRRSAEPDSILDRLSGLMAYMTVNGLTGKIVRVNELLCSLLGYEVDELVGWPLDIVIPGVSRTQHKKDRARYMKHPLPRPMGPDREVKILHKDDTEIRAWIGLAPITDELVIAAILPIDGWPEGGGLLSGDR